MSDIQKYTGFPENLNDSIRIADAFAKSGLFKDASDAGKAMVRIQAGAELGIPPFAAMSGIHIISGKPVLGAGLIASRVKASGRYDYKVLELNDTICRLEFYEIVGGKRDRIGESKFDVNDAKRAKTQNMDKFPANMLFARAISNGVKWFCPDVFTGPVYVPGEIEETQDVPHVVVEEKAQQPPAPSPRVEAVAPDGSQVPMATTRQKAEILLLLNSDVITKEEKEKMHGSINKLDRERADKAIEKLKKIIAKRQAEAQPAHADEPAWVQNNGEEAGQQ